MLSSVESESSDNWDEETPRVLKHTNLQTNAQNDIRLSVRSMIGEDFEDEQLEKLPPISKARLLFASPAACGDISQNVGNYKSTGKPVHYNAFYLDKQRILGSIYCVIGSSQVTQEVLDCAPSWLVSKAMNSEVV